MPLWEVTKNWADAPPLIKNCADEYRRETGRAGLFSGKMANSGLIVVPDRFLLYILPGHMPSGRAFSFFPPGTRALVRQRLKTGGGVLLKGLLPEMESGYA